MEKRLHKFSCGCEWEVAVENGEMVGINYEPERAPLFCPKVWELIATGLTKGIFQLETPLGQSTAYKCKPYGIEELSDLISIIRPGTSEAELDGKNLKQRYIDRKNGLEEPDPPHPALKEILEVSYGIFITQEQAMQASKIIAGFDGVKADLLRKAAGKKSVSLMAQMKKEFIEGAIKTKVVSEEDAEKIFAIIEASQRYSFNKSHGVSYSLNAYYFSAYPKAHFPRVFFLSELVHAKTIEDIGEVIDDARNFNIDIESPSLLEKNIEFELKGRKIHYGLSRVKGVGNSKLERLLTALDNLDINKWSNLLYALSETSSDAAENLIKVGALDYTLLTRAKMLHELNCFLQLNAKQKKYILDFDSLEECLVGMINMGTGKGKPCFNSRSIDKMERLLQQLKNPATSFIDSKARIFEWEMNLLGFAFTCSEVDEELSNCTCEEFIEGKDLKEYKIAGSIVRVKTIITKGKQPGQEMAFVELKDSTQKLSTVAFPSIWIENKHRLFEGNKVMIIGEKGKQSSLILKRVLQI